MLNRKSRAARYGHRAPLDDHRHTVYLGVAANRQASRTGLRDAVRRLIAVSRICGGPEIEFNDEGLAGQLRPELQTALSEVVRELLLNAICYSESTKASVRITQSHGNLRISVQDWGTGFDPLSIAPYRRGLHEVEDLIETLDGTMSIDSRPGAGSCVRLEIPMLPEDSVDSPAFSRKPR